MAEHADVTRTGYNSINCTTHLQLATNVLQVCTQPLSHEEWVPLEQVCADTGHTTRFSPILDCFLRVQSHSCPLKSPNCSSWGWKNGTVPSLKGTTIVIMWCEIYVPQQELSATWQKVHSHTSVLVLEVAATYVCSPHLHENTAEVTTDKKYTHTYVCDCTVLVTPIQDVTIE